MIEFRVVTITKDMDENPQFREDTNEFPQIVPYVEDEVATFVVDTRDHQQFWGADEFFACNDITHFIVDSSEAPG